jgi:hypothetical protein
MAKASRDPSKPQQKRAFRALSVEQEHAIELLLTGAPDRAVGEAVGVSRMTVWHWRAESPLFIAELNRRRQEVWRQPQERLRALAARACENLTAAVEAGDLKASIEVLKAIGVYGAVAPAGDIDPEVVLRRHVQARLDSEGPGDAMGETLLDLAHPGRHRRKRDLETELEARYLDGEA